MTVHFPDVSNHQGALSIAGASACIAKASEGTGFRDARYTWFRNQASSRGIPFAAYHWLHKSDVAAQARNAFAVVGRSVPLMIDDEDTVDGLDVGRTLAFVQAYRGLGGTVSLIYLPRWFWNGHGRPDLRPLAAAGLALISSHYTAYSDTGPGWAPYGGVTPTIWQYTSSRPWNGQGVDFNAFRGSVDELRAVFQGERNIDMSMTEDEHKDLKALAGRVEALLKNLPTVTWPQSPVVGERNELHFVLEELGGQVAALRKRLDETTGSHVDLGPIGDELAALRSDVNRLIAGERAQAQALQEPQQ